MWLWLPELFEEVLYNFMISSFTTDNILKMKAQWHFNKKIIKPIETIIPSVLIHSRDIHKSYFLHSTISLVTQVGQEVAFAISKHIGTYSNMIVTTTIMVACT